MLALGTGGVPTLGPDVVSDETTPAALVRAIRGVHQETPVGVALLDQRVVSGIGVMP